MPETPDEPTAPFPGPAAAAPAPGTLLDGRYELRAVLGRGGMATVWRAHDRVLQRDVAVKIFDHASALPDASARAAAEVRMLAGLNHPNLVMVHDAAGREPGAFDHLVMELVEGRSLRDRLDAGPMPPGEVAELGAELAAGLDHVHERGIVHRDLKPANVLLERTSRGTRAKIADFGVARLLEGVALTMAGTTVGTANYLSPEQATGAEAGPPSDVYSLGLVLLECLTGVMAYPGHGIAPAAARLHRPPDIPATLGPAWADVLRAMTALDPQARPTALQVAARLRRLAAADDTSTAVLPAGGPAGATAPLVFGPPALPGGATSPMRAGSTAALPAGVVLVPGGGTTVLPADRPRRRHRGLFVAIGAVAAAIVALALVVGLGSGSGGGTTSPTPAGSTPAPTPTASATPSSTPTTVASTSRAPSSSPATTTSVHAPQAPVPPGHTKHDNGPGKGGPGKKNKP